jgi:HAD superfamily hydrolase (TIGR01509 family)
LNRYKAVFFDVDGTLYRSREYEEHLLFSAVKVLAEMLGVGMDEAFRKLDEKKRVVKTVSRSVELLGLNRHEFYERLGEVVGVDRYIKPAPEITSMMRELRGRGVVVGLHTNSGRKLASKVLNQLGVDPHCYDFIVTSDDAEPKPDHSGYMLLLEKARVNPGEALYVGDRCEVELKPAYEIGMDTAMVGASPCKYARFVLKTVLEVIGLI